MMFPVTNTRGAGKICIEPILAVSANAVYNATGVRRDVKFEIIKNYSRGVTRYGKAVPVSRGSVGPAYGRH